MIQLKNHEQLDIVLPDGRVMHLFGAALAEHCYVDIWTTRGNDVEAVSERTADTTRAPMGSFGWKNGARFKFDTDTDPDSHGWPAVSTITLLWDK